MSEVKIVFGGGSFGRVYSEAAIAETVLATLTQHGVTTIDTAQLYGDSEKILGELKAGDRFVIDTKAVGGFVPGALEEEEVIKRGEESMRRLGMKQVDIFYIHMPDPSIPLSSTLSGINALHKKGYFKRFGLSNYLAADVRKVHAHCKENNYILPTVYQGNYNPLARHQESKLFPTLRELGMAFYAYSPLAGGFLTKTKEDIAAGKGRFDPSSPSGKMYHGLYAKPALLEVLATWERIAEGEGCSRAELANRWVRWNSGLRGELGDAVIVGASSVGQLEETLVGMERGPLGREACEAIEKVWGLVEHEAPLDNING